MKTSEAAKIAKSTDHTSIPTDMELVALLSKGSEAAFSEILNRYSEKVHHLAMRITRNEEDSEEVLQDVFVTIYTKIDHFEGKSAFSSWLYRITVNTAFMKLRKKRQAPVVSLEDVGPQVEERWTGHRSELQDLNFLSTRHELRAELEHAVQRLPTEYRIIFIMRDVDGLSNQEVGDALGLSIPAVKSRLHRSRLLLKKRLQQYYMDYRSNEYISYGLRAQEPAPCL
jgi:RNA polymerase sigma-70 factor, ECF subfamily